MLSYYDLSLLQQLFDRDLDGTYNLVLEKVNSYYTKVEANNSYIYCEGTLPVLLIAHLDTVYDEQYVREYYPKAPRHENTAILLLKEEIITSSTGLGADDKAGVYTILKILEQGYRPHILFTTDEELLVGESAQDFCCDLLENYIEGKFNYMIQLDRRGQNDCVFYEDMNNTFKKYVSSFGFSEAQGTYTDICEIAPILGISGVNLSVGYYCEHTKKEFLDLKSLNKTQSRVIEMLEDSKNLTEPFEYQGVIPIDEEIDEVYN